MTNTEDETDVGKALVAGGLLQVEKRKERRLAKLVRIQKLTTVFIRAMPFLRWMSI